MTRASLTAAALLLLIALPGSGAGAQSPAGTEGWGGERALELMRRAQERRTAAADTGLVNYQARALGRVYFYLDREDTGERNLVKTDQLALDVLWQAPDLVKQRIVGWRDRRSLPTNIHYHLDHLSVVQENFGEEIRIGDGDEVRDVIHPAAPVAERFYEYRLKDSLTLALPGTDAPVRVYEIQARPLDPGRPGFVGSVFVERSRGDIVRMDFTFTSAAYVDRYLDYINISLDNGLWRGRYWLPNEQRVEIRRRIPQLDIPAGTVIRANMSISGYTFNEALPPSTFLGPRVVALPRAERESFEFEEELDAEVREEGLGRETELGEIRAEAARLVRARTLGRLSAVRLHAGRASDVVRYNRAEGLALGAGLSIRPAARFGAHARLGYAFGARHPVANVGIAVGEHTVFSAGGYLNRPEDMGISRAASGVVNSLSSLLAARDFTDPYYASGAEASVRTTIAPGWIGTAAVRVERHRGATLEQTYSVFGGEFREVRPIAAEGEVLAGEAAVEREITPGRAGDFGLRAVLGGGSAAGSGGGAWLEPRTDLAYLRRWRPADASLRLEASGGVILGAAPDHLLYLMGGRGTVAGYPFRRYGGDRFALVTAAASADLAEPWARGRLLGSAGWIGGTAPMTATGGGPKASLGLGLGLLYDLVRIDVSRGIGEEGRWELVIGARKAFRDIL